MKKGSLKTMVRQAGSPSKAFRALRDHFLPLSESHTRVQEEKLKSLRMRSGENPSTFFTSLRETLGSLQMIDVHKNDREVSNLMLAGLSREYYHLRETLNVIFRNNPLDIETHVRERYLDLQTENTKKTAGVALAAKVQKKNSAKTKPKRSNSDSLSLIHI